MSMSISISPIESLWCSELDKLSMDISIFFFLTSYCSFSILPSTEGAGVVSLYYSKLILVSILLTIFPTYLPETVVVAPFLKDLECFYWGVSLSPNSFSYCFLNHSKNFSAFAWMSISSLNYYLISSIRNFLFIFYFSFSSSALDIFDCFFSALLFRSWVFYTDCYY